MGSALVGGIVASGSYSASDIHGFDAYAPASQGLSERIGTSIAESTAAAIDGADVILLCVKPADIAGLTDELHNAPTGSLVISIAAGVTISQLEEIAGPRHRILRVMPNTPALVGLGVAGIAPSALATPEDLEVANRIFSSVGTSMEVPEKLMDAVTGLSGSGPAYVYTFIEALADGGVLRGLPRDKAIEAAAQTVMGAAKMVIETGLHPAQLRDQVTSPGGTTISGLNELEAQGFRAAVMGAVSAATDRSIELGKS